MGISFSDSAKSISGQYGYHILRVQENSPAQAACLQPFFDFIVSINGHEVSSDPHQAQRDLSQHLGRPVQLLVYSSKFRSHRRVTLRPRSDWGGQGLLGATVRLCAMAGQPAMAWRVLDVSSGSPAEAAGLRPGADYIVGCADAQMHSQEDLFDAIEARAGCSTRLYVYNSLADRCRLVAVTPDPNWGGEGSLGCGIGYGYLHQIPGACEGADVLGAESPDLLDEANSTQSSDLASTPSEPPPAYNNNGLAQKPSVGASDAGVNATAVAASSSVTVV